jgi:hypothetical protein
MDISARVRATKSSTKIARLVAGWQLQATGVAFAAAAFVLGGVPLDRQLDAPQHASQSAGIHNDSSAKSAREAKRAERAAAREAKKKERAARSNKSDDRSLAKAKTPKTGNGSGSVDLGDDDPLEGL